MLTDLNQGGKLTDISYLSCTVSVRSDVTVWRLKKDPPVLFWYVIFQVLCLRQPFDSIPFKYPVHGQGDPRQLRNSRNTVSIAIMPVRDA